MSIPASEDGMSVAQRYRIDEVNLAARRELLRFDSRDVRVLASLGPWMRRTAPAIAREF